MTDIKFIILAHLTHKLFPNPLPHLRAAVPIKPTKLLYFTHDPSLLALPCKDPTETQVIHPAPERKVGEEKYLGRTTGKKEEEHDLESEKGEIKQVQVRFWVVRVEESSQNVVRRGYAEYYV